jgi:hypothetical protein
MAQGEENSFYKPTSSKDFTMTDITIRSARLADDDDLKRLAALDSQRLPAGDLLVAEVGGELVAAYAPLSASAIADPFLPTADAVELLRLRAGATARDMQRQRRGILGALPRFA